MQFLGTMEFDGSGNFYGAMTTISPQGVIEQKYGGTYKVENTGVGSFHWTRHDTGLKLQSHIIGMTSERGIFTQLYSGFDELDTSDLLQGRLIYRVPTRLPYNNKSLHGTFWIGKGAGSPKTDFEGLMSFDGISSYWGIYTYENDGGTIKETPFAGSYEVKDDGVTRFKWSTGGSHVVPISAVGTEIVGAFSAFTAPLAPDGSIQVRWLWKRDNTLEPKNK